MPQLLIRDIPEQTHKNIASAAAQAGRSMQAELLSTIQKHYASPPKKGLLEILMVSVDDDADFEITRDTPVRDFAFEEQA